MRFRRRVDDSSIGGALIGVALVLLGSCTSVPSQEAAPRLSPEDEAVYQMLSLELADFIKRDYKAGNGICIAVSRSPSDMKAVPVTVFEALQRKAAGSAVLIPYSADQCPFDNWSMTVRDRVLLSAHKITRSSSEDPNWLAGVTFETLYGWGHAYDVVIEGSRAHVKSLYEVIS
jgi:hypothetical protein